MITGVAFLILGEAILFGALSLVIYLLAFMIINTLYFKISEEPGLAKRFGDDYREYRKNVRMWIPRLRAWHSDKDSSPKD
jgi:protein-S-isoprenylcysteine O-methyltransferase Ste14